MPSTAISREALLDELVKIGAASEEQEPRKGLGHVVRTVGTIGAGTALGYGLSEALARKLPYFSSPGSAEVLKKRQNVAKIILPILGGTAAMLADRYRQSLNKEYSKVRGFRPDKK